MIEKITITILSIRVRRLASRSAFDFVGLFFELLFAILTHLSDVWKEHPARPVPILRSLQVF